MNRRGLIGLAIVGVALAVIFTLRSKTMDEPQVTPAPPPTPSPTPGAPTPTPTPAPREVEG